jgi:hypothetical protein
MVKKIEKLFVGLRKGDAVVPAVMVNLGVLGRHRVRNGKGIPCTRKGKE